MAKVDFGASFSKTFDVYFKNIVPLMILGAAIGIIPLVVGIVTGILEPDGSVAVNNLDDAVRALSEGVASDGELAVIAVLSAIDNFVKSFAGVLVAGGSAIIAHRYMTSGHVAQGTEGIDGVKAVLGNLIAVGILVAGLSAIGNLASALGGILNVGLGLLISLAFFALWLYLYLIKAWFLGAIAASIEDRSGLDAMNRAEEVLDNDRWTTIGFIIVVGIIAIVAALVPGIILAFIPLLGPGLSSLFFTVFVGTLMGVAMYVCYHQLTGNALVGSGAAAPGTMPPPAAAPGAMPPPASTPPAGTPPPPPPAQEPPLPPGPIS